MKLSNHSYTLFNGNRERFRLIRGLGLEPEVKADPLQRGYALHLMAEGYFTGDIMSSIHDKASEEGVNDDNWKAALYLWPTLQEYLDSLDIIAVEMEFEKPLKDGHFLTGRVEAVAKEKGSDILFIPEYKSAGPRKRLDEITKEWKCNTQADFELIGARFLGHDVQWMDVQTVKEGTPPMRMPIRVQRTDYELAYLEHSVWMTCCEVEFLEKTFGYTKPWAHTIPSKWDCDINGKCNNGWCEFKDICGQELDGVPAGFKISKHWLEERAKQETKLGIL